MNNSTHDDRGPSERTPGSHVTPKFDIDPLSMEVWREARLAAGKSRDAADEAEKLAAAILNQDDHVPQMKWGVRTVVRKGRKTMTLPGPTPVPARKTNTAACLALIFLVFFAWTAARIAAFAGLTAALIVLWRV